MDLKYDSYVKFFLENNKLYGAAFAKTLDYNSYFSKAWESLLNLK